MANNNNQNETKKAEGSAVVQETFFDKHKKAMIYAAIAVVVIVAGCIIYHNYVSLPRQEKASTALARGQDYFSMGRFDVALNGDSVGYAGFVSIAADYGSTDAGNLANLYAGLCYAQLDKWTEAASYLEKFDQRDDQMVSPAALGALGNAYAHLNQTDKAVETLTKAARAADNNSLSPTFLIQAGEILESQGKKGDALKLYQEVKEKYFNSLQYQTIDKYIERASVN